MLTAPLLPLTLLIDLVLYGHFYPNLLRKKTKLKNLRK